jgi:putative ABC transport system permease protein
LQRPPDAHVYESVLQTGDMPQDIVIRAPQFAAQSIRAAVRETAPAAILSPVTTLADAIAGEVAPRRFQMALVSLFAALAWILATSGIYAVMHYSVAEQARDIAIRIAVGAQPRDILRLVIGQSARLTAAGLFVGVVAALALTRFMQNLLFAVKPADPLTFGSVVVIVVCTVFVASLTPALRATKIEPMVALRNE